MLVIDWRAPCSQERHFGLADYIAGRLEAAFAAARQIADGPIGGLVALALRCQHQAACLALLTTPWDFMSKAQRLAFAADRLARLYGPPGSVPVEAIQTLSFILDPFTAERKFIRFATFDPEATSA